MSAPGCWIPLAVVLGCAGCRLSDPVYAFRELDAPAADGPAMALVYGRIVVDAKLVVGQWDAEVVHLVRVDRNPGETEFGATERITFRVMRERTMKEGYFLILVPPGVYELFSVESSVLFENARFEMTPASRKSLRLYITRPGIYDLGSLVILSKSLFDRYELTPAPEDPAHLDPLRAAVKDTAWESWMDRRYTRWAATESATRLGDDK